MCQWWVNQRLFGTELPVTARSGPLRPKSEWNDKNCWSTKWLSVRTKCPPKILSSNLIGCFLVKEQLLLRWHQNPIAPESSPHSHSIPLQVADLSPVQIHNTLLDQKTKLPRPAQQSTDLVLLNPRRDSWSLVQNLRMKFPMEVKGPFLPSFFPSFPSFMQRGRDIWTKSAQNAHSLQSALIKL